MARMFGFDAAIRRIRRSGFYIDPMQYDQDLFATTLWIEADFEFPELKDTKKKHATVPSNFVWVPDTSPERRCRANTAIASSPDIATRISAF